MLNIYLTHMSEIIIQHKGTIDKYIGDAIMAYWNAPIDINNYCDYALEASLKQLEKIEKVNEILKSKKLPLIKMGIGLNKGEVIIGEMGSEKRSDYTIIGDEVNLASRLEGLTKIYGANIIISDKFKKGLTKNYHVRYLDFIKVKGKDEPIIIYEVDIKEFKYIDEYQKAIELYLKAEFEKARDIFYQLYNKKKELIYKIYLNRCLEYIENPVKYFDGVFEIKTK